MKKIRHGKAIIGGAAGILTSLSLSAVEIDIDGRLANSEEESALEWGDNSGRGDSGTVNSVPVGTNRPDPVSDDDGTVTLTVTANIQDWRVHYSAGEYDAGEEWNVRSSHNGLDAEAALANEAYFSITLDTTANGFDLIDWESVSVSLWRNGSGADPTFQLAVDANDDGFDVGDLVGSPTTLEPGLAGASTLSLGRDDLPKGVMTAEVRLYHWGNGSPSGNMHLYDVVAGYEVAAGSGLELTLSQEEDGLEFTWPSLAGFQYDLRSSTDLTADPATWPLYDDGEKVYEDIVASETGTHVLSGVRQVGAQRFFVLVREPVPPLFAADFESDNGNFTVSTREGSDWEYGTPDTDSAGGRITTGANGSSACWGTVLGSASGDPESGEAAVKGFYLPQTETTLSTPVIDLTAVTTPVSLSYQEALDLAEGATAGVFVVDHATGEALGEALATASDGDSSEAPWTAVNDLPLPAEALGKAIRIEFRFQAGSEADYAGWYLDEIRLEAR
ncbi:hypothetical protein [Roseibacillus ishigakijimensis]|uniref:Uncharacterized protein n=1 Tax=Roseibacillus ishigakijimensis TaxID=454146 RepID=A0A934RS82_9BACT|nr:hypothetical protein [Roseibacillus ishigakijimensis]MBK1833280.1 hypothetical protein [Roseibacillus ishigakijimensis]